MTYLENIDQYGFMELAPRQVELDESEKLRIRKNIANSKSKLAKMSEIEKTALTAPGSESTHSPGPPPPGA